MKKKYLFIAVVAIFVSSCENENDVESVFENRLGSVEQGSINTKAKEVKTKFFDGYIVDKDGSVHKAKGTFVAVFEDGKLVDLKFYGTIDGVDGTYGFLIREDTSGKIDLLIKIKGGFIQVLSDEILRLFDINVRV